VEAGGERAQWQFGQTMGSADPWPPPLATTFGQETSKWDLMLVLGGPVIFEAVCLVVDPWILVLAPDSPERCCL
jgi:hypothetical protein